MALADIDSQGYTKALKSFNIIARYSNK